MLVRYGKKSSLLSKVIPKTFSSLLFLTVILLETRSVWSSSLTPNSIREHFITEGHKGFIKPVLDISKAFDKVWQQGLLYKLKQNSISGNLLETLTDFFKDRKQRVVVNGQNSSWANVEAGVPQGSILGPLLFLIYINDLPDNLSTNVKLFADDTSLFSVVHDIATSSCDLNYDLNRAREWAFQW